MIQNSAILLDTILRLKRVAETNSLHDGSSVAEFQCLRNVFFSGKEEESK